MNHKKDCMSSVVNPITEWAGGSNLVIVGYECPECGVIEYDRRCEI